MRIREPAEASISGRHEKLEKHYNDFRRWETEGD
jgi:hypothetical protein